MIQILIIPWPHSTIYKIKNYQLNKTYEDKIGKISGILALDKPPGITSHDLVDKIRHKYQIRKVGHTGTLDPFATGLIIILIGKATKLSQQLSSCNKTYKFELLLGLSTNTQDIEGTILKQKDTADISRTDIEQTIKTFPRCYKQNLPIFSSIKIDGIKLYELAHSSIKTELKKQQKAAFAQFTIRPDSAIFRKLTKRKKLDKNNRITVEIPKRQVHIFKMELLQIKELQGKSIKINTQLVKPKLRLKLITIRVHVSKGTYIRQLAEDIGSSLQNTPAMLYSLRRTQIAEIDIKQAKTLEQLNTV